MRDPSGWIGTPSGTPFWPLAPCVEEIHIEDIAHALARQCRFNGLCGPFYSVAEHSIEVSRALVEGQGTRDQSPAGPRPSTLDSQLALWGLLHDAAETYLGDVVRPLKRAVYCFNEATGLKPYQACEDDVLELVARRFGLPWPMPEAVAVADTRMLATERQQLFDARQPEWPALVGIEPYRTRLQCLGWELAELVFLARFRELTRCI